MSLYGEDIYLIEIFIYLGGEREASYTTFSLDNFFITQEPLVLK